VIGGLEQAGYWALAALADVVNEEAHNEIRADWEQIPHFELVVWAFQGRFVHFQESCFVAGLPVRHFLAMA
jgi:hypothetical protein